jgi:uncharacterized membrane protein YgdD (TMEM256/DUF423 family)
MKFVREKGAVWSGVAFFPGTVLLVGQLYVPYFLLGPSGQLEESGGV